MSLCPRFLAHPVLIDIAKFVHIVCFCSCGIHATTATTLWPLYRSVCVSRHLQLRTGGFCWCKVLLPAYPCYQHPAHSVGEKTMKFCSALLIYLVFSRISNTQQHTCSQLCARQMSQLRYEHISAFLRHHCYLVEICCYALLCTWNVSNVDVTVLQSLWYLTLLVYNQQNMICVYILIIINVVISVYLIDCYPIYYFYLLLIKELLPLLYYTHLTASFPGQPG